MFVAGHVHGPLLGWAKLSGDVIFEYKQPTSTGNLSYMMPRLHGVDFFFIPGALTFRMRAVVRRRCCSFLASGPSKTVSPMHLVFLVHLINTLRSLLV